MRRVASHAGDADFIMGMKMASTRNLKPCKNKRDEIPVIVVNLHVKYHVPQKDGTRERLIPCYSFAECLGHEQGLMGVAETERRKL